MSRYLRPVGPVRRRRALPPMLVGILMLLAIAAPIIWALS